MKIARLVGRWYAVACALVITPALLGVLLAHFLGMQPIAKLEDAYARWGQPAATVEAQAAPTATAAPGTPAAPPPPDLRTWERRMQSMGAGIVSNVQDLTREIGVLEEEARRLRALETGLAALASAMLHEPVDAQSLTKNHELWLRKIEALRGERTQYPKLLATLQTLAPEALAVIVAGRDGAPGLGEEQAVALLSGFPPRKAGEVLGEIGELDPSLAARMVARMGGQGSGNMADNR